MALIDEMPPLGWDNGEQWTTVSNGQAFEQWIGANVPGMTRRVWAHTRLGTELATLTVGPDDAPTMYINGGIHGTEYAGRECVYVWVQDLARKILDGDTATRALIARRRFVIICQSNPDGTATRQYGNSLNIDPAQDGFRLREIERQTIERVFQEYRPIVVSDHHEYIGSGYQLWTLGNRGMYINPQLQAMSEQLHTYVDTSVRARGYTVSTYGYNRARALGHTASFRHCLAILSESKTGTNGTDNPPDPRRVRMNVHAASLAASTKFFDDNAAEIQAASDASREDSLTSPGPEVHAFNEITMNTSNTEYQYITGYEIESELPDIYRECFGLTVSENGAFLPIKQEHRGFIPEIADPNVLTRGVVARQRIDKTLLPGTPDVYVRVNGSTRPVTRIIHHDGTSARDVTVTPL